ncbi:MAG: helix-turn-helix domain-containing protein [Pyrinomonadaceae bacterium]
MSENRWKAFGSWLQLERERAEVSQADVAAKANIHVIQLSRIENGHSGLKRETLERIVKAINDQSASWDIDLDEALNRAGFASALDAGAQFEIGDKASVKLSDQDLSPEDQEEIAEELALAYELIMARRKAKKAKTE